MGPAGPYCADEGQQQFSRPTDRPINDLSVSEVIQRWSWMKREAYRKMLPWPVSGYCSDICWGRLNQDNRDLFENRNEYLSNTSSKRYHYISLLNAGEYDWMMDWEGCGRKWSWSIVRYCVSVCLEGLKIPRRSMAIVGLGVENQTLDALE
jgi:hypothetical protein